MAAGSTGMTATSTWLDPWSWYYSSTSTTTKSTSEPEVSMADNAAEPRDEIKAGDVSGDQLTDAAAETKDDDSSSLALAPAAAGPTVDDPASNLNLALNANPIVSTIETNPSGWASFFSSRALMVKTLGYGAGGGTAGAITAGGEDEVKRDENGMEVMDLDLDEEEEGVREVERELAGNAPAAGVLDATKPGSIKEVNSTSSASDSVDGTQAQSQSDSEMKTKTKTKPNPKSKSQPKSRHGGTAPLLTIAAELKNNAKLISRSNSGANTPVNVPPSPTPSSSAGSRTATPVVRPGTPTTANNSSTTTSTLTTTTSANGSATTATTSTITTTTTASDKPTDKSKRTASPTPSKKSASSPGAPPAPVPNLVLPTWQDTFHTAPRNVLPPRVETYADDQGVGGGVASGLGGVVGGKLMKFVSGVLFAKDADAGATAGGVGRLVKGKERAREGSLPPGSRLGREAREGSGTESVSVLLDRERQERFREFGKELPKAWSVLEDALDAAPSSSSGSDSRKFKPFGAPALSRSNSMASSVDGGMDGMKDVLRGCRRVVVIGVHGWFPGAMIRTVLGEPTGTSTKFANMTEQALQEFEREHGVQLEKITKIPLEGDGTIEKRVERLYANLQANEEWMADLHAADAILVATHSQGSIVSTHLLDRLMRDGHIVTSQNQEFRQHQQALPMGTGAESFPASIGLGAGDAAPRKVQRVCLLALCGIHLGPLRYLSSSTLVGPYLQYFESTAARELFEFQNTESTVSKEYAKALQNVLDHGTKVLYIASLNDQVVPIYSGLFTAVSHPLIMRALYIDGDAYHSSDFLSNLLVLLLRILNSGMSDSGLLAHLSEATAGSLNGVGHSTAYEEVATYSLAVKYLFLANEGMVAGRKLGMEPFNATHEQNDYEIPWSLRDIIADERVAHFFGRDIAALRDAFREWHPKTTILRDLKRKLQPIQRLGSASTLSLTTGTSKL
ncbi:hypothetical protein GALMADRAFT_1293338 [Galerina marginata CBS 339.88]|uniref:YMC020W-like alpha/beta hydrolase domain-containing protein n=1 Tax=Galerina marginata (strain CBS 339.88) TaxID=685588 RepID=A0A067TDE0_GALM3|nr:hypothetical protein GALMADRAFT_1293338 [Galerina marginata CBS 339.88]